MIYGWRCYDISAISPPSTWKLKCKFIASDLSWSQENSGVQYSSLHNAKLGSRLGEVWFIANPLAKTLAVTGFNWDWFQFRFPRECVYPIYNDCCAVFILSTDSNCWWIALSTKRNSQLQSEGVVYSDEHSTSLIIIIVRLCPEVTVNRFIIENESNLQNSDSRSYSHQVRDFVSYKLFAFIKNTRYNANCLIKIR